MISNSSSEGMTSSLPQPVPASTLVSPTGMYSMKRTCNGRSIESLANSRKSWFRLRTATAFTFTGFSPTPRAASMPAEGILEAPRARDLVELVGVKRIQRDIHAREPRRLQVINHTGQKHPVGGHGDVLDALDTGDGIDQIDHPLAHQRLAPRETNRAMPTPAATATNRSISSMRRISSWDIAHTPSSGMQ